MWAGAGGGSSLGPEWVSVSGTGRRPSRVRLLNEEWTERPVCRGDRRPLGPSRAYTLLHFPPPELAHKQTELPCPRIWSLPSAHLAPPLVTSSTREGPLRIHLLSCPGWGVVSRRREGGPELFCSARRLAFPCCLWGLEEPARQQGPARASGPQPLRSVICNSSPLLLSAVLFWLPGPVSQCPLCPQGAGGHTSPEGPHCCTPGTRLGPGSPWETSGGLGGGRWWGECPHSAHQDQKPLLSPSPSIRTGAHPQIPPHRAGPSRQHLPGLLPTWNAHPACHFPPAPGPSLHLLQAALALPPTALGRSAVPQQPAQHSWL